MDPLGRIKHHASGVGKGHLGGCDVVLFKGAMRTWIALPQILAALARGETLIEVV